MVAGASGNRSEFNGDFAWSDERGAPLPPDQCVPRGGAIAAAPAQAGHCPGVLAP